MDLEVFGLSASDAVRALLERFGRVETVGASFPVYKCGDLDVALPRRESKAGRGHKGFVVQGDPAMSVEEAARRRDFTINAMPWDPLTGEYLDPFGGREDLAARVLRVVDPATFGDDSLRVLRALQFAARFDLRLEEADAALCRAIPLDDLPAERVWGEVEKLLLPRARRSASRWRATSAWSAAVAGDGALDGCPQEPEWHPEGDVWVHTLQVVDEARRAARRPAARAGRSRSCSAPSATTSASRRPPR